MRFSRVLFPLLMSLMVIGSMVPFHLNPNNFLADDAYFYPQIAWNIASGKGSTFHGITPTNGYHPLWMLICAAVSYLSLGSREFFIHLLGIVQVLFYLGAILFLFFTARLLKLNFISFGVAVLTFFLLNIGGLRLFESHLAILLQMATIYYFTRWLMAPNMPKVHYFWFGLLLSLVFLSRLDIVFYVGVLTVVMGAVLLNKQTKQADRCRCLLYLSLGLAVLTIFYLGWNVVQYGHFVPISGALKSSFPIPNPSLKALGRFGWVVVFVSCFLLIGALLRAKERGQKVQVTLFSVLLLSNVLHAMYIFLFSGGSQWYWITAYSSLPIALMFILGEVEEILSSKQFFLARKGYRKFVHGFTLAFLSLALFVSFLKVNYNFSLILLLSGRQKIETKNQKNPGVWIGKELKRKLPPETSIFVYDSPGAIAYYSDLSIMPLDSLVSDYTYHEEIVKEGMSSYFEKVGIRYLLTPDLEKGKTYQNPYLSMEGKENRVVFQFYSPLSSQYAGEISLERSRNIQQMPTPTRPLEKKFPLVALWELDFLQ